MRGSGRGGRGTERGGCPPAGVQSCRPLPGSRPIRLAGPRSQVELWLGQMTNRQGSPGAPGGEGCLVCLQGGSHTGGSKAAFGLWKAGRGKQARPLRSKHYATLSPAAGSGQALGLMPWVMALSGPGGKGTGLASLRSRQQGLAFCVQGLRDRSGGKGAVFDACSAIVSGGGWRTARAPAFAHRLFCQGSKQSGLSWRGRGYSRNYAA
jgi:hypothetical protein